ncbi:MAG: hypothetical protein MUW56_06520 [Chryseobacterium sp.]|uniref:hypothetical protein n=1 Tax=Chryseobacterium sp. TaxID=1871047 RepID=UPI0025C3FEA2|nr:hypothetical protein [Chryseobacterium sp.]MCJ7933287.1 hypothetical protein [Chryseobacterium sp.]
MFHRKKAEKNTIYLYFRETKSKAGLISKSYNINNSNYSHVGIGGIINGKEQVYHILFWNDGKKHFTDLRIESIDDFFNPKNEKVLSGGVYSVKNVTPYEYSKFTNVLDSIRQQRLAFDKKFESIDDNKFYCSELVISLLRFTKRDFHLKKIKKKLTGIDAVILNRDSISYYPTDIFMNNENFTPVEKW